MRAHFLINPKAHRVAKRGSALMAVADRTGTPYTLLDESYRPTKSVDRIYIEGGDGTVSWVLSRYLDQTADFPEFAIVKGGTTDQIAGIIGLERQTGRGIEASLTAPARIISQPLLRVETASQTRYGFVLSTGVIPRVTEQLQSYRGGAGMTGIGLVGRAVLDVTRPKSDVREATHAKVMADLGDEQLVIDGEHLGLIATTLPSLYLGLDPFWGEEPGAIRFTHAIGDADALMRTILGQWAGRKDRRKLRQRGYQSHNAHSLSLSLSGPAILDGETLDGTAFAITTSPSVDFVI